MALSDRAQAQYETSRALRRTGLIDVRHDARIEQRRGLKRILQQEIGTEQSALLSGKGGMCDKGRLRLVSARLKLRQQIAVAPLEVLEHLGQLPGGHLRLKPEHPAVDAIGPGLVRGAVISRFGRRFE